MSTLNPRAPAHAHIKTHNNSAIVTTLTLHRENEKYRDVFTICLKLHNSNSCFVRMRFVSSRRLACAPRGVWRETGGLCASEGRWGNRKKIKARENYGDIFARFSLQDGSTRSLDYAVYAALLELIYGLLRDLTGKLGLALKL